MVAFKRRPLPLNEGAGAGLPQRHSDVGTVWPGIRHANIIKTGERRYCIIAQWESSQAIVDARPQMIATLNAFREALEDLGDGLG